MNYINRQNITIIADISESSVLMDFINLDLSAGYVDNVLTKMKLHIGKLTRQCSSEVISFPIILLFGTVLYRAQRI